MSKQDLASVIDKRKKALSKQKAALPADAPVGDPERNKRLGQMRLTRKKLKRAQRNALRIAKLAAASKAGEKPAEE